MKKKSQTLLRKETGRLFLEMGAQVYAMLHTLGNEEVFTIPTEKILKKGATILDDLRTRLLAIKKKK